MSQRCGTEKPGSLTIFTCAYVKLFVVVVHSLFTDFEITGWKGISYLQLSVYLSSFLPIENQGEAHMAGPDVCVKG